MPRAVRVRLREVALGPSDGDFAGSQVISSVMTAMFVLRAHRWTLPAFQHCPDWILPPGPHGTPPSKPLSRIMAEWTELSHRLKLQSRQQRNGGGAAKGAM